MRKRRSPRSPSPRVSRLRLRRRRARSWRDEGREQLRAPRIVGTADAAAARARRRVRRRHDRVAPHPAWRRSRATGKRPRRARDRLRPARGSRPTLDVPGGRDGAPRLLRLRRGATRTRSSGSAPWPPPDTTSRPPCDGDAGRPARAVRRRRLRRDRRRPAGAGSLPRRVRSFQRMVDTRPDLASYARVSYALELRGDVDGAIAAMRAAYGVAAGPSDIAGGRPRGQAHLGAGRRQAVAWFRRAAPPTRRRSTPRRVSPHGLGARGRPARRDRGIRAARGPLSVTRARRGPRRPLRSGGRPGGRRATVGAGASRGETLPGQRRERRPRAGAVRGRSPRRWSGARSAPPAPSGPAGRASTSRTRSRGLCTRTAATGRPRSVRARPSAWAPATRCSCSTRG